MSVSSAAKPRCLAALALLLASCGSHKDSTQKPADDGGVTDTGALDAADPGPTPEEQAVFDRVVEDLRGKLDKKVPGAAVAVVLRGKLAFAAGVGVKAAGGTDPVTEDSLFRVASLTKVLVAAGLMLQVEDGTVDLDHPVTEYVPYFARGTGFDASKVLVRHLLSHTAGIPDDNTVKCTIEPRKWITAHGTDPLWSPPGRLFDYSNGGYVIAAMALQEAAGASFMDVIRDRVLGPAGMTSATFEPSVAAASDHTTGHHEAADGTIQPKAIDGYDCPTMRPWAGMIASVKDYAHLAETFLANGAGVLQPRSITAMTQFQAQTGWTPDETYGFGTYSYPWHGLSVVGHDGLVDGWKSIWLMVPGRRFAVVVFLDGDGWTPEPIALGAIDAFLGVSGPPPDYSTPSSTWTKYAATYQNPYTYLGDMVVTLEGGSLFLAAAGTKVKMFQEAGDDFSFRLPTWSKWGSGVFFLDDKGAPEYFATRDGVGVRVAKAVAVAPPAATPPKDSPSPAPPRHGIFSLER